MCIERNENGGLERRVTAWKPQTMKSIDVADADVEAIGMDSVLCRQRFRLKGKAAFEARRRRRDDQCCRKELRQPNGLGMSGGPVRISWET